MKTLIKFMFTLGVWSTLMGCAEVTTKTFGKQRTVTVKYSTGWFMAEKNRAKAVQTAREYCQPNRPVLVREDNKTDFTGQTYTSQHTKGDYTSGEMTQAKEKNVYMHFVCSSKTG